jgi:hypothetical protein
LTNRAVIAASGEAAEGSAMSEKHETAEVVKCPLCEGRGELKKSTLLERLNEKDLRHKVANYLSIVESEQKESVNPLANEPVKENVTTWNLTHFLWRRSPKE